MQTKIVRLSFLGPVHFGEGRLTDSGYTCDASTLFSALFIEALHTGMQDELLAAAREGGLLLSDAFPYIGETLYLPKPMVSPETFETSHTKGDAQTELSNSRERKANKKLSYVPALVYKDYFAGRFDALSELERFNLGVSSLQTKVNLLRKESLDAEPYAVGTFSFAPNAGIYFMMRDELGVVPLLESLSYSGLGGKRTSGYGRFTFNTEDVDPTDFTAGTTSQSTGSKTQVLLSTSIPREDELNGALLDGARYRLVRRGGFAQSVTSSDTLRKKRDMYLFAAGSTFAKRFEGDVFDVNTNPRGHPVYRYAKSMCMEV